MIKITEFGKNVYLIKSDLDISEIKMLPEVVKLVAGRNVEFKLHDHGIWILHIL